MNKLKRKNCSFVANLNKKKCHTPNYLKCSNVCPLSAHSHCTVVVLSVTYLQSMLDCPSGFLSLLFSALKAPALDAHG